MGLVLSEPIFNRRKPFLFLCVCRVHAVYCKKVNELTYGRVIRNVFFEHLFDFQVLHYSPQLLDISSIEYVCTLDTTRFPTATTSKNNLIIGSPRAWVDSFIHQIFRHPVDFMIYFVDTFDQTKAWKVLCSHVHFLALQFKRYFKRTFGKLEQPT